MLAFSGYVWKILISIIFTFCLVGGTKQGFEEPLARSIEVESNCVDS